MEDHFHAAVLLRFEGLIEIGAVSEIFAAVGDEKGGVNLLLLDELGQRLEITLHVRLAAAQHQALLHDRAHVDGDRAPIDAGNRDHTAWPHRSDGLVEDIGPLGRHDFLLHRADETALSVSGARFHADAIDHHIGALAFADLLDPLEDVLFREIDDVGGAGLLRHGDALRYGLNRDDALSAQNLGGLDRGQDDRTRAPDRRDLSALDAGLLGGLIACGENIGQEEDVLVLHSVRHFHGRDIGHGHAHIFGLAARVAACEVGVAKQAGRRVAELRGRHRRVAVGALADGIVAQLALPALAAIDIEGNDDPIALPELRMSRARLDHLAHELVPEDIAALHRRHQAIHQMKVRAADRAARHLDDDISTVLDFRVGNLVAANIVRAVPAERLHGMSLLHFDHENEGSAEKFRLAVAGERWRCWASCGASRGCPPIDRVGWWVCWPSGYHGEPDDWVSGGDPMTGAEASYLETLSEECDAPNGFETGL